MDKDIYIFTVCAETLLGIITLILIYVAPITKAIIISLLCLLILVVIVSPLISEDKVKALITACAKFPDSIKHITKDK